MNPSLPTCRSRNSPHRGGFTLIEMMIVLAVMAAMAALTLPAMRAPLDKSRLRAAGRQLQAGLAKSRATAIREGVAMEFVYETGGQWWKIQRADASRSVGSNEDSAINADSGAAPSASRVVREGRLPDGVRFLSVAELALQDAATSPNLDADAEVQRNTEATAWSAPIRFRPNGRSSDASLTVIGSRDFAVTVSIRGLTSAVRYSAPFRLPASQQWQSLCEPHGASCGLVVCKTPAASAVPLTGTGQVDWHLASVMATTFNDHAVPLARS